MANPAMLAARAGIGAPYHVGRLQVSRSGHTVTYTGARLGGGPSYRLTVRPGRPIEPSPLDVWLTSRWRAFTERFGTLVETPITHEPWPLATAAVEDLREDLTTSAGLPPPAGDPVVHYSEGVRKVRIGPPRPRSLVCGRGNPGFSFR